ncbi:acetoacetate decarboxylase [Nocardioides psychrotolerans]|uniref:Acetoacetate decarboxylase (ADC) n=1 Tax=Nocardioides psychrotolerans TaxID=1005945 RepID=A0A1I3F570_9ACTN|nr:acetoacetate decarboxylase family protein [Nocardioides psychrotolerans]GEP37845.1 acetoacetate decarboxylase [Nocardioides psychrotolerans]SFI06406.1 Acetoacetate decarboxylase (ADC) [Nocardioides psychrotolerans]
MSTPYPPEPWDLAGTGHLTTWAVPTSALPALPFSATPVTVRGRAIVSTAFVAYSAAGLMSYDELLAAVVVRHGRRVGLSITDIWVDSETSMLGGRGLWGIPKDLASFDGLAAGTEGGPIASASFTPRRVPGVPLPFPLRGSVVQTLGERTVANPIRASGRLRPAAAHWDLSPDGPLAWLRAGRPLTSVVAEDFRMRFGR